MSHIPAGTVMAWRIWTASLTKGTRPQLHTAGSSQEPFLIVCIAAQAAPGNTVTTADPLTCPAPQAFDTPSPTDWGVSV